MHDLQQRLTDVSPSPLLGLVQVAELAARHLDAAAVAIYAIADAGADAGGSGCADGCGGDTDDCAGCAGAAAAPCLVRVAAHSAGGALDGGAVWRGAEAAAAAARVLRIDDLSEPQVRGWGRGVLQPLAHLCCPNTRALLIDFTIFI